MIDLADFIKHINNSNRDKSQDFNTVKESIYKYPYFQIGYTILAKISQPVSLTAIQKAAIYATDRTYLKAVLNSTPPFNQCAIDKKNLITPEISHTLQEIKHEETIQYEDVAMVHFINGYIDEIYKKAPQEIVKHKNRLQYATIAKFLKANIKFQPNTTDSEATLSTEDFTKDYTIFSDDIATEKLAQILISQGKVESALDIYKKIILKYPHRKEDFDSIIKNLNPKKNV